MLTLVKQCFETHAVFNILQDVVYWYGYIQHPGLLKGLVRLKLATRVNYPLLMWQSAMV